MYVLTPKETFTSRDIVHLALQCSRAYDLIYVEFENLEANVADQANTLANRTKITWRDNFVDGDFTVGDLTTDGNWHTLDLANIVPANANHVYLHTRFASNQLEKRFGFKPTSHANIGVSIEGFTQVADVTVSFNGWLPLNANKQIDYVVSNSAANVISIATIWISGWSV